MTATKEPEPLAPKSEPSIGALGWQPYRYGESPVVAEPPRGRTGLIAIVLGGLGLVVALASVVTAMLWSSLAAALTLVAAAAVLALAGVVCSVLALAMTRMRRTPGGGQAVVGVALSSAGFAAALLWTVVLVLTSVAAPVAAAAGPSPMVSALPSPTTPAAGPVAGAGRKFRFEVTGTVPVARISYQFAGTSGGDTVPVPVPWSKDVNGGAGEESFSINAYSETGQQGSVTCAISDAASGTVLDTKTVETDGSPQSSAYVDCSFYG